MTMIEHAYKLLPPPLAALPAKYWTSISLWLHSYTVGRTFQEFIRIYSETRDIDAPDELEAFIIGFLHDMGQKLRLRGRPSEEKILAWVKERLEALDFTNGEADELSRYLFTNPAETLSDPLYDRSIWRLLWLADRLQGIDNPLDIPQLLEEAKEDLDTDLNVALLNISVPQPFIRTLVSKIVHDKIRELIDYEGKFMLPVSTPYGLVVITDEPELIIEISWDEIRKGFDGKGLLDEKTEEDLYWNMRCCDNKECRQECSKRSKPQECKDHNFTKRDCEKGEYLGRKGNSYMIALTYYGFRHRLSDKVVLPGDVSNMLQGILLKGVEFRDGRNLCPICGIRSPVGVTGDFLQFFIGGIKTEQWNRTLYPGSVNRLMQDVKPYVIDPLCLGETIIRGRARYSLLISLTIRASMPLVLLEEIGKLLWSLLFNIGGGVPKASNIHDFIHNEDFDKRLDAIVEGAEKAAVPNFYYDAFSTTITVPYRNLMQRHQDEWLRDMAIAGTISAWGLYPITISETMPSAPNNTLLSYYKGRKPLYDYQPSDKRLGGYTPYVATTMMSIAVLNYRKSRNENLPAVLEVLDYPPEYSPALLQYSSPDLYSLLESLRVRIGVRA